MAGGVLVDTNVLVYAYDRRDLQKQDRALTVLRHLVTTGRGFLSAQVLAEFFSAATTKLPDPLPVEEAARQVQAFLNVWPVEALTALIVLEATRGVREHRLSFWDAQIWATALLTQASAVLSEDFKDGSLIEGIRFLNPFAKQFELAHLG